MSNHFSHIKRYFSYSYLDASECNILRVFYPSILYSSYSTVSLVCMLNLMLMMAFCIIRMIFFACTSILMINNNTFMPAIFTCSDTEEGSEYIKPMIMRKSFIGFMSVLPE